MKALCYLYHDALYMKALLFDYFDYSRTVNFKPLSKRSCRCRGTDYWMDVTPGD
jgi:hypothetical protein